MNNFKQLQEYFKSKIGKELKVTDGEAVKLVTLDTVDLHQIGVKQYIDLYFTYKKSTIKIVLACDVDNDAFIVCVNGDFGCLLTGSFNFNELDKFSTELKRYLIVFTNSVEQYTELRDLDLHWK
ncbi:hypothetical protein CF5_0004 [Staphylococcus phage CF5]|uniref:Uncharacterized protein n=1 Tax=Staphylococcus phage CF5 TaxID=3113739 RepID=A0AAX4J7L9_9CAUD|nr:hypothetical protein CF5_0004 [Staphylococcus phage CF5]